MRRRVGMSGIDRILQITAIAFGISFCLSTICLAQQGKTGIEGGIPAEKLAYYEDSFQSFRSELWDRAGYLFTAEQMGNFRAADLEFGDSGLIVETVPGSFSKGGLGSKYVLRGDFEIQIGCEMDFYPLLQGMDQMLIFTVVDVKKDLQHMDSVSIGLFKKGARREGFLTSGYQKNGKYYRGSSRRASSFSGALKIQRIGDRISTFFRKGEQEEWKKTDTFRLTANDVNIGFLAQNYMGDRNQVSADKTITARFHHFRINGAQEIVEPEI
jgi:hypothetical protein